MTLPFAGDSIANDTLQIQVLKELYSCCAEEYKLCSDFRVINTQVVHYPYDVVKKKGRYVKGYWKELWSVKACDRVFQFPLTFYIYKNKTTFDIGTGSGL